MLSNLRFKSQLKLLGMHLRYCTNLNINNNFRPAENENHNAMSNEQFKYKTTASENFLSTSRNAERLTSFVENIQVLSPTEFVKNSTETMSEVARDRLGQWPVESESELEGQGMQRLKNGRFNKVSRKWKIKISSGKKVRKKIDCRVWRRQSGEWWNENCAHRANSWAVRCQSTSSSSENKCESKSLDLLGSLEISANQLESQVIRCMRKSESVITKTTFHDHAQWANAPISLTLGDLELHNSLFSSASDNNNKAFRNSLPVQFDVTQSESFRCHRWKVATSTMLASDNWNKFWPIWPEAQLISVAKHKAWIAQIKTKAIRGLPEEEVQVQWDSELRVHVAFSLSPPHRRCFLIRPLAQ